MVTIIPFTSQAESNKNSQVKSVETCTTCESNKNLKDFKEIVLKTKSIQCSPRVEKLCKDVPQEIRAPCDGKNKPAEHHILIWPFLLLKNCFLGWLDVHVDTVVYLGKLSLEGWKLIYKESKDLAFFIYDSPSEKISDEIANQIPIHISAGADITADVYASMTDANLLSFIKKMWQQGLGKDWAMRECFKTDMPVIQTRNVCTYWTEYLFMPLAYFRVLRHVFVQKYRWKPPVEPSVKPSVKPFKVPPLDTL